MWSGEKAEVVRAGTVDINPSYFPIHLATDSGRDLRAVLVLEEIGSDFYRISLIGPLIEKDIHLYLAGEFPEALREYKNILSSMRKKDEENLATIATNNGLYSHMIPITHSLEYLEHIYSSDQAN